MSDNFVLITKNITDFESMQKFAEAQHKTIIELSKRIKKLQDKNTSLEALLKTANLPTIENNPLLEGLQSEEYIATLQLEKLKNISIERELTLEEARKVEIYSKILKTDEIKKRTLNISPKKLSDDDLLNSLVIQDKNGKE